MEALIVKFGVRLPLIIARALAGDPTAIAQILAVGGIAALSEIGKKFNK